MTATRVGAVGYLNTRPLVHGLDADEHVALRFDVPSTCAALLHAGAVDVAMVPSIEFLRGDYRIVPGVAIASLGEAASVALFTRVPLEQVRTVALDTSSRTSVALLKVLCAERFHIAPRFLEHAPSLGEMLRRADAALLIGDPALYADEAALGVRKVDLGSEWTAHTGLPFVFAFWAGRPADVGPATCRRLRAARDRGLGALDEIARDYGAGDARREEVARHYLRHNMKYDLGEPHIQALRRFYVSAAAVGAAPAAKEPAFVDEQGTQSRDECTAARGHER